MIHVGIAVLACLMCTGIGFGMGDWFGYARGYSDGKRFKDAADSVDRLGMLAARDAKGTKDE